VLVVQAFLLDARPAALRLGIATLATVTGVVLHPVPIRDAAIQIPFVYGLAGLVILLARTVRRSRATAVGALKDAEHLALYDTLTDLPNRVLFNDRIGQALAIAHRDGTGVALLLMDLDRFKEVNDTFGHHVGDLLLQEVGPHLRSELRPGDTLARLGGDEFGVLLPATTPTMAALVAGRLLRAVERPFEIAGQPLTIGASIGIACSPDNGSDAATLLRRADVAMYVAKRSSGSYVAYAEDQDKGDADRLGLMAELAAAIDRYELVVLYQPQIDASSGRVVAAEALVRWRHPMRGMLAPSEFIPLAERSALITRLTEQVIATAVRDARAWRADGADLRIAVNISARSLFDSRLVDCVREVLAREDVAGERLLLEITESALMADQDRAIATIRSLRELGVGISIDDYGTGYSSIAYLRRLAADEVKIDRSFVSSMWSDANAEAIVRATLDLAHVLGFEVVAEGVEEARTRRHLIALGIDRLQGYGIGRPMEAGLLVPWVRARSEELVAV
ncbi:MAG TPA: EAL domain-containing protein, partial [Candidatus Limnocylindria bacterium]|nr:EAL domain-containing protein [Candidatus Limnocylindria bacterium]